MPAAQGNDQNGGWKLKEYCSLKRKDRPPRAGPRKMVDALKKVCFWGFTSTVRSREDKKKRGGRRRAASISLIMRSCCLERRRILLNGRLRKKKRTGEH